MFEISLTPTAADQVRAYRKFEQKLIFDAIERQSRHEPLTEIRDRKRLGENALSDWELWIQQFRVFYGAITEEERQVVKIKAVGHKEHSKLIIGDKEVHL